jgi:hypothetical protein
MSVQDVKDSFYVALRGRVAAGNAERTVVVRGVARPGLLVVEDELPGSAVDGIAPVECFCLRWVDLNVVNGLAAMRCEIRYATDGSAGLAGMDRGRAMATMDTELAIALDTSPQNAPGVTLAEATQGAANATAIGMQVFWSDVTFGPATMRGERMERKAEVEVFGYV